MLIIHYSILASISTSAPSLRERAGGEAETLKFLNTMAKFNNSTGFKSPEFNIPISQVKWAFISVAAALVFTILLSKSCTVVDSGEIGIKFHKWDSSKEKYGGVEGTCKGWVFYNPITTKVFTYPTYLQRKNYEPFNVNAKDASTFQMDPTIAYRIDPAKACDIFVKYREGVHDVQSCKFRERCPPSS